MRRIVFSAIAWTLLVGWAWAETAPPVLSVSGAGQVAVVPDMAVISLGVVHVDKTAGAAMAKVGADARALIDVLGGEGVAARDIQTSQLSVGPVWDTRASGPRTITGFEARTMVTVRVRDLDGLGAVLDKVLDAGANTFNGLSFQVQDPSAAEAEARAAAVREALEKAQQLSAAAGLTLGPVLRLSEGGAGGPRPELFAARAADVPIAAGEVTIRATVSMEFALEP
ncbi:SIMPL domain-containing protein [uncultured Tateyamaria sp.]|uniref:SIMPL domain-containing protein n=1 Tax=uncultured Tateyamaria sp. TaxID=455651 RepID=UPI0026276473|nr:SIMPL domain-containing protein [uncultured Tateyamaria sp.]